MWLFRRGIDIERAAPRPIAAADLTAISRLLRSGARRFYALAGGDLPGLVEAGLGVALVSDDELAGVAVAGWPVGPTAWLRGLALAEGVPLRPALKALIPAFHQLLAARGVTTAYYAGDDSAETWLDPSLPELGYRPSTEVIVYEKRDLSAPAAGNPTVTVAPATPADLPAILEVDRLCFEPQWTKDNTILGPAITEGPFFVAAALDGRVVGYAYATTHFGGRLVHLVRIAAAPGVQGRGVGVRLMAELTTYARRQGADLITLNTQAYNLRAQRLYRWFGFVTTGERQIVLAADLAGR